jgi:hypothetical protein
MARKLEDLVKPDAQSQERARLALNFLVKEQGARYEVRELRVKGKAANAKAAGCAAGGDAAACNAS